LGSIERCALLNYPNHLNIGDHLIWCGTIRYLSLQASAHLAYIADIDSYSHSAMNRALGHNAIILFHGGGSLGDLWPDRQLFHEAVIAANHNRPIVILPQTIYFQNANAAARASRIFQAHPNLTVCARDQRSFSLAQQLFPSCRLILAPDMAFALQGLLPVDRPERTSPALFLRRKDRESAGAAPSLSPDAVSQDWISYERKWRWGDRRVPLSIPLVALWRDLWQRRIHQPQLYKRRIAWLAQHASHLWSQSRFPDWRHRFSLGLAFDGMHQLRQFQFVATDRLHAHILAELLGIPNLLLANSYYKNKAFYETWTHTSPLSQFRNVSPLSTQEPI
jgi:pyruvyl transferase EpsO